MKFRQADPTQRVLVLSEFFYDVLSSDMTNVYSVFLFYISHNAD